MISTSRNRRGERRGTQVTATAPPTAVEGTPHHLFSAGAARISTTWIATVYSPDRITREADVAHGSTLYHSSYGLDAAGNSADGHYKIGSGWGAYLAVAASSYRSQVGGPIVRNHRYGLRNDGVLVRWTVDAQHTWRSAGSYPGFAAVKTMTQISRTSTYDTFLATTRGGALYTIRIPVSSPMKPVVKQVRASTWGAFDYLVAERCGQQSTLLTAIDKDAGTAYLYAVGHANGTATVIRGVGKIPGTFTNPLYYLITPSTTPPLYGE